jgi:hypothetical protein
MNSVESEKSKAETRKQKAKSKKQKAEIAGFELAVFLHFSFQLSTFSFFFCSRWSLTPVAAPNVSPNEF